jgi:HJR/Mrr/RecB family endonuclease
MSDPSDHVSEPANLSRLAEELVQKAREQGYITTDDLLNVFPEAAENMAQLEEIFIALIERGIEVYSDEEEAEEEKQLRQEDRLNAVRTETLYDSQALEIPETRVQIRHLSPSFGVLEKLLSGRINLDTLHWREFEELVAELLEKDGYIVDLGPGRKDGGVDIFAAKDLGTAGLFKSVWQAKKKQLGNKVGLSIIRELADTRAEYKASKGIIVTTTYLTQGALDRVKRDTYILGKVDRDDLMMWTERILRESRH